MKRRAWIWGGTCTVAAAAAWPIFRRLSSQDERPENALLTQADGPLLLREGFRCRVLARSGDKLTDGSRSADLPDGMACFELSGGRIALLRNHELTEAPRAGAYPGTTPPEAFDARFVGGVSRLVLDKNTLGVVSSNTVLTGTHRNCGGGPSPWGFLSCEESRQDGHGYVFLCPADADSLRMPYPIPAYGRFRHEAICVDPDSLVAYLTEDEPDGAIYRFSPTSLQSPFEGNLEALTFGSDNAGTGPDALEPGRTVTVGWVPVPDPRATHRTTRSQAQAKGAARFARPEGIWLDGDAVVFACTTGGRAGLGQLFRLELSDNALTLLAESTNENEFAHPDNITIAPWGDVILAEDTQGRCHIRGVTKGGQSYPIAANRHSSGEIAGVCFSPDDKTLFCNLQRDGLTVAISGPFETLWDARLAARSRS